MVRQPARGDHRPGGAGHQGPVPPRRRRTERVRAVRASSDPGAGRLVAAAGPGRGGPVPGARVRSVDSAGGDAADAGWVCAGRQGPLLRAVQLHRLAADQGGAPGPGDEHSRAGDLAAAVQPAGTRDRVGDRAPALDAGIGLLPWSALGGGWLSGKYQRDARPAGATRLGEDPGRGMEAYDRRGTERTWRVVDAVRKIAAGRGVTMAEIALAWVTARPAVTATILGARTTAQLEANLRAADVQLTAEETAELDATSDPGAPDYPYGELGAEQRSRSLAGGR